jgi:membrane-bound lytic murein transglycosylase D
MRCKKYGLLVILIVGLWIQGLGGLKLGASSGGVAEASTTSRKNMLSHSDAPWLNYRFTVPPELRTNVDFWKSVYTKYTSDQVIIHHKDRLDIIYTVLDFSYLNNSRHSYRAQKRIKRNKISEAKRKYRNILKKLAKPNLKLAKLSAEERRVYELFSSIKGRHKFRDAAGWRKIRSQVGQRDRFIQGMINSGLYMREIEKIFARYRLPQELTLLPFVESFFSPEAHSNDGAVGIWQFIRSTGRLYLRIDSVVDERRDPYKASEAAARLLLNNYKKLGYWPLAITAYNHGSQGMKRAVKKTGSTHLPTIIKKYRSRKFGFASKNFYAEFLAVLEIVPNRDRFFGRLDIKSPQEFDVVELPYYTSIKTLNKYCLISKEEIKKLNPGLTRSVMSSQKYIPKDYPLRIPPGTKDSFLKRYAQIPRKLRYAAQKRDDWHRVRWGETLSQIARRYKTSVSNLMAANNLSSSRYIRAGQRLRIPQTGYKASQKRSTKVAKAKSTPKPKSRTKAKTKTKAKKRKRAPVQLAQADNLPEGVMAVIVKPHESIGHYADWAQISASSVRRLNDLSYRQKIHVGQIIEVDYSKVGKQAFEEKREAYHRQIQQAYLEKYRIERVYSHTIKPRQNVWYLCRYKYKVPLWLVEKYNQDKNLTQLTVGDEVLIPIVVSKL